MSSSCLTGGSRTCSFDLDFLRSPSTSSWTANSSSPSSTLSDSSNYRLAISTRKPRTPRKRLNQAYNEAATLLSTACPTIFPTKHITKPRKFTNPNSSFFSEPLELLLPCRVIDDTGLLLHQQIQDESIFRIKPRAKCGSNCESKVEYDFQVEALKLCDGYLEDFDIESMLDEQIDDGVDSIMGNLSVTSESVDQASVTSDSDQLLAWYCHPMGLGFGQNLDLGVWMRRGIRALKHVDEAEWWSSPTVNVLDICPKFSKGTTEKMKKKSEKPVEKITQSRRWNSRPKLLLKLNYEEVLNAWSDRGTPFSKGIPGHEGNDLHARLAQIDLFSEIGRLREASELPYKEKRVLEMAKFNNVLR